MSSSRIIAPSSLHKPNFTARRRTGDLSGQSGTVLWAPTKECHTETRLGTGVQHAMGYWDSQRARAGDLSTIDGIVDILAEHRWKDLVQIGHKYLYPERHYTSNVPMRTCGMNDNCGGSEFSARIPAIPSIVGWNCMLCLYCVISFCPR